MQQSNIERHIEKPTLLLDNVRAKRNIKRMVRKAKDNEVILRPHFKTHQSAAIGEWFRERGIHKITVSSLDMATYFTAHGWEDITVAFPVNIRQTKQINDLARRIRLGLLFESPEVAREVNHLLDSPVKAWIKIDTGYHRTGIAWNSLPEIRDLCEVIDESSSLQLTGLLTHAGHTYSAGSRQEVIEQFELSVARMNSVRLALVSDGYNVSISVGDTPGCSVAPNLGDVDEIRPGNFIFYDLTQQRIGSCDEGDIAVGLACPVVARHPERNQLVIYGGAIHFSKEKLMDEDGVEHHGYVTSLRANGWDAIDKKARLVSISQEHGVVEAEKSFIDRLQVGDLLIVLPVHSCLTANLMGQYLTLDGRQIKMARI